MAPGGEVGPVVDGVCGLDCCSCLVGDLSAECCGCGDVFEVDEMALSLNVSVTDVCDDGEERVVGLDGDHVCGDCCAFFGFVYLKHWFCFIFSAFVKDCDDDCMVAEVEGTALIHHWLIGVVHHLLCLVHHLVLVFEHFCAG